MSGQYDGHDHQNPNRRWQWFEITLPWKREIEMSKIVLVVAPPSSMLMKIHFTYITTHSWQK
jgi:hypothetical protein